VAWDPSNRRHAYLEHGDVVFAGNSITFVGRGYPGAADETIDGRGLMVMPGLVNVHAHPGHEASYRGIREEHGVPEMYMSGLFERASAYWPDDEGRLACAEAAYCELLLSGVTTLVDISGDYPGWIDLIARSGLRGVLAPATPRRGGWCVGPICSSMNGTRRPVVRSSRRPCGSVTRSPNTRAGDYPA
jgi:cytosine/adenosine deaminase-related metal-dependent hydrolase